MARPTRLDIEGGWYHVLNRGIKKRVIFRGAYGYQHFCGLIASLPQRFGLKVHGYVLMPNHYHLQVETPRANLSRAIARVRRTSRQDAISGGDDGDSPLG